VKVLLFGASGMVGQGVLRECLLDPAVETVLCVGRRPLGQSHPKLRELVVADLGALGPHEAELTGFDAGFLCLGVSSAGMAEAEYRRVTHDLTLAIATPLARWNPGMTITYVSGAGTDSTEHGRSMWGRVKGQTENDLLRLPFRAAYMFRPGVIRGLHGIRSRSRVYRIAYAVILPFVLLIAVVSPNAMTTTEKMGRAMIHVVQRGAPERILPTRAINQLAA
jgi:uncharacterized protein YbjT (DUF2867 family)